MSGSQITKEGLKFHPIMQLSTRLDRRLFLLLVDSIPSSGVDGIAVFMLGNLMISISCASIRGFRKIVWVTVVWPTQTRGGGRGGPRRGHDGVNH